LGAAPAEKGLFVAGGLRPGDVREAIRRIGPYGLDVCNGVRTKGELDTVKLRDFFEEIDESGSERSR
jgi:phosphoribosylanthranilate isomerase